VENAMVITDSLLTMPDDQIDAIIDKLLFTKISRIEKRLTEMQKQLQEQQNLIMAKHESIESEIINIKDTQSKTIELAANSLRVKQPKLDYVNQGDFGRFFDISIGGKTVGKLLKVVGLAQKSRSYTTPYREHIPKYAVVQAHENYSSFKWNYTACMKYIDEWLKENDLYETFYAMETTHKLEQFINSLYDEYV
jgi:MFS superfamily sulfate permease-like transporter